MKEIKGIGFDLFNTLITIGREAFPEAMARLTESLSASGFALKGDSFQQAYRQAALSFVQESRTRGTETHNRFWISAALKSLGHEVEPDHQSIAQAVEAYFSTFFDYSRLIPKTREMLSALKERYRLGLLSNFTHAPAAVGLLDHLGLTPYFDTVLISGALGFRKPHPLVFERLVQELKVGKDVLLYVGDSLDPDVLGAIRFGITPIWMTYVQDHHLPVFPTAAPSAEEVPPPGVVRVSDWDQFLNLLR